MNFGVRAHDIHAENIGELSEKLAKYGLKSIQLALKKSITDIEFDTGSFSPGFARFVKGELDKNDISVSVLGSYINPVDPNEAARKAALDFFVENLKYAKYIGADMVGTETGTVGNLEETHSEKTYQIFLQSMKRLVSAAESLGVMIGIEAVSVFTINNPQKMKRFLDDINSENVSVILDVTNMITAENYKVHEKLIDEAFSLYKDKIAAVHLKDFKYENGVFKRVVAGEGEFNFKYLFGALKKHKPYISMLIEELEEKDILKAKQNLVKIYSEA